MSEAQTVWEALVEQLRLRERYNSNEEVAPAAILWPDPERQWEALAPRLRAELPQFLTLGDFAPEERTGPAIWLKAMLSRALEEADWPEEAVPIIYLPGVSRRDLRPEEEDPAGLAPLVELQYLGVTWLQASHREWTIIAFVQSERGGLGLDVAADDATRAAAQRALEVFMDEPLAALRGQRLDDEYFDLLIVRPIPHLLRWLNDPEGYQSSCDAGRWEAFCSRCSKYGFDPGRDGATVAAELLGRREGLWEAVWERFAEAPSNYPQIPERLDRAAPEQLDSLFDDESSWPKRNALAEAQLGAALKALEGVGPQEARDAVRTLEGKHNERREWVWAKLDRAPLARALEHLARLAQLTAAPLAGSTPQEMAERYAAGAWQADAAVLRALDAVRNQGDMGAVQAAVRALYADWLEQAAIAFQTAVSRHGPPSAEAMPEAPAGCCVVFADGLRLDVAQRLAEALQQAGLEHELTWQFAALPTVTATTKPAVSPVAKVLSGGGPGAEFTPALAADGKALTAERFRRLLEAEGVACLSSEETGDPQGRAWTEHGSLDRRGHDEGGKLAWRIKEEVRGLAERVRSLAEAGWKEVRVITDHGWLLLPGGLPKVALPQYLAESRWGRCAELKETSQVTLTTVPWHWDREVQVAMASGISRFVSGEEYAHGGLSVQECVAPVLTVAAARPDVAASIAEVSWTGLRVRAQVEGAAGLRFDVRTRAADAGSSLAKDRTPVVIADNGRTTLLVENDELLGTAAVAVVLDDAGDLIARQQTVVGGSD